MIQRIPLEFEEPTLAEEADPPNAPDSAAAIEAWLSVLLRLIQVSDGVRREIGEELREHLRERVRDLMLSGCPETEAAHSAIEELGATAELARRFQEANRPRTRRFIMQLSLIGAGAGAVLLSVIAVRTPSSLITPAVFEEPKSQAPAAFNDVRLTLDPDVTLGALVEKIVHDTRVGVSIDWGTLEQVGMNRDAPLGLGGKDMPLATVLELISARGEELAGRLDWRYRNEMLVIDTADRFDHQERIITSYPVDAVIDNITQHENRTYDDAKASLIEIIERLVEPEAWQDNGGDIGQIHVIGGKMFVQAPPRMQHATAWILQQLAEGRAIEAATDAAADVAR